MKGILVFLRDRRPKTIAKDRAEVAADELLAIARENRPSPRRVDLNLFDALPELDAIDPTRRERVLREANRKANNQWQVVLSFAVCLAVLAMCLFMPPRYGDNVIYVGAAIALVVPFLLIRRVYVRRHILDAAQDVERE